MMEKLEKINEILDNYIEILTIHHLDCEKLFEVKQIITDYYELVEYLQFVKELYVKTYVHCMNIICHEVAIYQLGESNE